MVFCSILSTSYIRIYGYGSSSSRCYITSKWGISFQSTQSSVTLKTIACWCWHMAEYTVQCPKYSALHSLLIRCPQTQTTISDKVGMVCTWLSAAHRLFCSCSTCSERTCQQLNMYKCPTDQQQDPQSADLTWRISIRDPPTAVKCE